MERSRRDRRPPPSARRVFQLGTVAGAWRLPGNGGPVPALIGLKSWQAKRRGLAVVTDELTLDRVLRAADRLTGVAHKAPALSSATRDQRCGAQVLLKAEPFQRAVVQVPWRLQPAQRAGLNWTRSLNPAGVQAEQSTAQEAVKCLLTWTFTVTKPLPLPAPKF
jgi:hypothetical protein